MNRNVKNIIIIYDYCEINGGAAKVAIQSAIALSQTSFNVFYFSATGQEDNSLITSKINVTNLGINDINNDRLSKAIINGIWNRTVKRRIEEYLRSFSPDDTIIHIHGWSKALSSVVVRVACKRRFKTIITLHDYFTVCPNGGFYNYKKEDLCKLIPMSAKCMVCNCDKRNFSHKL